MSLLRRKAETTLGKKKVLGLNTTLFLCKARKGSLKDKDTSSDTRLSEVIATSHTTLWVKVEKEMSLMSLNGGF